MADKNQPYAIKMLHHHGFLTRSDVTSKFITGWDSAKDTGRADIFVAGNGKAISVEVKNGNDGWNTEEWRDNQREWAAYTTKRPFSIPYWMYLTIGTHPPHYNPEKYTPRKSWLIPYESLIKVIDIITEIQKTIPYKVRKGMKKAIQAASLDAITLLKKWELEWAPRDSLIKPEWLKYESYAPENDPMNTIRSHIKQSQPSEDNVEWYGGFWVLPQTHHFYQKFVVE